MSWFKTKFDPGMKRKNPFGDVQT